MIQCTRCLGVQYGMDGITCGSLEDARTMQKLMPSTFLAREIVCEVCSQLFSVALLEYGERMRIEWQRREAYRS